MDLFRHSLSRQIFYGVKFRRGLFQVGSIAALATAYDQVLTRIGHDHELMRL